MKGFQKIKSTSYLQRLDSDLKEVAEKHEIDRGELEEIVDHFFMSIKGFIEDNRMPKIFLKNFGTFKPTTRKIDVVIRKLFKRYRAGAIEKKMLVDKIKDLWPIKQRIIDEQLGKNTWQEWKDRKFIRVNDK